MKTTIRATIWCGAAALLLSPAGCEDSEAARRDEIQQIISQAGRDFQSQSIAAIGTTEEEADAAERGLSGIVSTLSGVSDGEPGQQAAAAQLSATVRRELAGLTLDRVGHAEMSNRARRRLIRGKLDARIDLETVASRQDAVSGGLDQPELNDSRAAAVRRLEDHAQRMADLDGPIAERTMANNSDGREVEDLRRDADASVRRAAELGYADGFSSFEEGITLRRQADQIEYEIAQREIDLVFDLESEHALAETQARSVQGMIEAIDSSQRDLSTVAESAAVAAVATRDVEGEFGAGIETLLAELADDESDLAGRYQSAIEQLDQAAVALGRVSGQAGAEAASSAKLMAARVEEIAGRVHWQQARGLSDHQILLGQLAAAGLGDSEKYRADAEAAGTAFDAARDRARDALTRASELAGQVNSPELQPEIGRFKAGIQTALAAVAGQAIPAPSTPRGGAAPSPDPGAAPAPTGRFDTAQALVDYIGGLNWQDLSSVSRVFDLVEPGDDETRGMVRATRKVLTATQDLVAALESQFGAQQAAMLKQGISQQMAASAPQNASLVGETGDTAVMSATSASGTEEVQLVRTESGWKIDGASMFESSIPPGQSMDDMIDLTNKIAGAYRDMIERIEGGEFSNAMEAQMALGQALMGAMGGAMGGGQGMPGR